MQTILEIYHLESVKILAALIVLNFITVSADEFIESSTSKKIKRICAAPMILYSFLTSMSLMSITISRLDAFNLIEISLLLCLLCFSCGLMHYSSAVAAGKL